jgi:hypothetical protein
LSFACFIFSPSPQCPSKKPTTPDSRRFIPPSPCSPLHLSSAKCSDSKKEKKEKKKEKKKEEKETKEIEEKRKARENLKRERKRLKE